MNNTKNETAHGDAYYAVQHIYDKSPGRSWRRLNGALQQTLEAAITAHLAFAPGDFRATHNDMQGRYWMGNSEGDCCGERFYTIAVDAGNTSACIAFEQYAGRPPALWSDRVPTATRLRIGSELTWQNQRLTVTNIRRDHLVACSYDRTYRYPGDGIAIGDVQRVDGGYRQVEHVVRKGDSLAVHYGPLMAEDPYRAKPTHIVKIPLAELAAARRTFNRRRRETLAAIAAANTREALAEVSRAFLEAPAGTYRHFDIEDIRAAGRERERLLAVAGDEEAELERWMAGATTPRYFTTVRLRVRADRVETSTGQSVTVAAAREALPVVLRRRNARGPVHNLRVDSFDVRELTPEGVQIGCTLVPWPEVERLPALLKGARSTATEAALEAEAIRRERNAKNGGQA